MLKAVLDTNVVLSAHLIDEGPSRLIFDVVFPGYFRCFVSKPLLEEYEEVLKRPRFELDPREIARSMGFMRNAAILVVPRKRLQITNDPDDNKVLECALEARADYVVTGNTRDFPERFQDIRIITPRRFMTLVASAPTGPG
jgi:putative PIN family toxin of toxin-antitoxin system